MNLTPKKKTIALCILFAVVFCLHSLVCAWFCVSQIFNPGPISFDWYRILTLALTALVYLPLSIVIARLAKKAGMGTLGTIAKAVTVILAVAAVLSIVDIFISPMISGLLNG